MTITADRIAAEAGPHFKLAYDQLSVVAVNMEATRKENLDSDGELRHDPSGFFTFCTQFGQPAQIGFGFHPLGADRPFMLSSVVTDGGSLAAQYNALKASLAERYPDVAVGHGRSPYSEFVVYAKLVYPDTRSSPPIRPGVVNSGNGVSIMYSITGSREQDPVGIVVHYKGLRRCCGCGVVPEAYVHGQFRRCKHCGEQGGMVSWYCSKECQRSHWAQHKLVCKVPRGDGRLQRQLCPL